MGISLGWVVFLVAGVTGNPPADRGAAQMTYTVKMVEADGVGWREAVFTRLKPVARQGAATVWTLPRNATASLIKEITKNPAGVVVQGSRVIAASGVPAAIQVRGNRTFITQVAWNGDESAAKGTSEDVRVGWHATMVGRALDQGILVKMVIEDTEIRGVHKVNVSLPHEVKVAKYDTSVSGNLGEVIKANGTSTFTFEGSPFAGIGSWRDQAKKLEFEIELMRRRESPGKQFVEVETCCQETSDAATAQSQRRPITAERAASGSPKDALDIPEIANQEVLGEWLIPNGECLLVSFGPHTVADKDGKAVVRERLAFVEAEQTGVVATPHRPMMAAPMYFIPPPPVPIPPPAAPAGAYATPVPNAAGVYMPTPMAPVLPGGVATPTPFLAPDALPPARYMRDDLQYLTPAPKSPQGPASVSGSPISPAPIAPGAKMPMPAVPDRSFPQGIHTDGSKAKLPPLPEDEMDDDSSDSESAEPLPSPQTKKPRKPKPAGDAGTTKATFVQPRSSTVFLPSVFLPGASVGFQFLMPLKPLSLKLPFNQRLEIEIFGRVVPDTRAAESDK